VREGEGKLTATWEDESGAEGEESGAESGLGGRSGNPAEASWIPPCDPPPPIVPVVIPLPLPPVPVAAMAEEGGPRASWLVMSRIWNITRPFVSSSAALSASALYPASPGKKERKGERRKGKRKKREKEGKKKKEMERGRRKGKRQEKKTRERE
jgi:hypothetical protein